MEKIRQNPVKKFLAAESIRRSIRFELKHLNPSEKVAVLKETRDLVIKDLVRAKEEVKELEEALNL